MGKRYAEKLAGLDAALKSFHDGPQTIWHRIAGDWPGLGAGDLHEGRDLRTTTDMRSLFKGLLAAHLDVGESVLESKVFPDSRAVRAMEGLVA